MIIAETDELG